MFEKNTVLIEGEISSPFTFSHEVFGEGFYMTEIAVRRFSGTLDLIPVMVSERLVDVTEDLTGVVVFVAGQLRSYNLHDEKRNKLVLSVFARGWDFMEEDRDSTNFNEIVLDGYVCKPPVYRKTPLGREIADLFIAVNRPYGKSDYIPCIFWGRNARFASHFGIGDRIKLSGRIQSREYHKRISETEVVTKTAYEVSVKEFEVIQHDED